MNNKSIEISFTTADFSGNCFIANKIYFDIAQISVIMPIKTNPDWKSFSFFIGNQEYSFIAFPFFDLDSVYKKLLLSKTHGY